MPITYALLLCVPIGALFYFEMRWVIKRFFGSYGQKEIAAARLWGLFGALIIPFIYCSGLIGSLFPQRFETIVIAGIFVALSSAVLLPILAILTGKKEEGDARDH
jgi:hypothetical protein